MKRHFSDYQFYFYATRKSLKEGAIPTLNLPHNLPIITSPPRLTITIKKREESSATQVLSSSAQFYKDFLQFKQRIVKLQINDTWSINLQDNYAIITFLSETHFVPKYELFVDQSLRFTLIIYVWMLPEVHNLYLKLEKSLYNLSLSNLIREIEHLNLCVGITQPNPSFLVNFQKHIVPRKFDFSAFSND